MRDRDDVLLLVERYQRGDRDAAEALLAHYAQTLVSEARDFATAGTDVDDLRQEARLALLRACGSYRHGAGANIDTYVKRCIRRALIDQQRHAARKRFGQHADVDDRDTVAEPVASDAEARDAELGRLIVMYEVTLAELASDAAHDAAHDLHAVVRCVASRMVLEGLVTVQGYQLLVACSSPTQLALFDEARAEQAEVLRGVTAAVTAMLGATLRSLASGVTESAEIAATIGVDARTASVLRRAVRQLFAARTRSA